MTSTSSKRPYFNKNIEELSTLVQANKENKKALKQILHELSFRSRPKAKALAKSVSALLEAQATPEQLSLPLESAALKTSQEELSVLVDAPNLEERPQHEVHQNETTPATEAAPQAAESLWDKMVNWFRVR